MKMEDAGEALAVFVVALIAVLWFQSCPAHAQPDFAVGGGSNIAIWIVGAAFAAGTAFVIIMSVIALVRWARRHNLGGTLVEPTGVEKPTCPACKLPSDGIDYHLPRLAVPRRTTNLGQWQIQSPEEPEDQTVKVCSPCFELALALARVERERLMERRASDRRAEMERLATFQRTLPDEVRKIRCPEVPPPPPEVKP